MKGKLILLAGSVVGISRMCPASTPEAWAEFEGDVRTASEALVENVVLEAEVYVDPFGSESYGMAIVHGFDRSTSAEVAYITVYEKATGSIEISGEILLSDLDWWKELADENQRLRRALEASKNERR